jgi:CheY-like chemotaxis protein
MIDSGQMSWRRKPKVLLVEDDPSTRNMMLAFLHACGYDVIAAEDGESALELVRKNRADVVLLDLMMPRMDGAQVLEYLRQWPETRSLPVVLVTALEQGPEVERAKGRGIQGHFVKAKTPYTDLIDQLQTLVAA